MKKQIRVLTFLLIFSIMLGILPGVGYTADIHEGIIKLEAVEDEIVTVSIDVKKNVTESYALSLVSPKNMNDFHSTSNIVVRCVLRLCANGDIRVKPNGEWVSNDNQGSVCGTLHADGLWHNIKMRYNSGTGLIEIYVDNKYLQTVTPTVGGASYECKNPLSIAMFVRDDSLDAGGIEWNVKSVIGSKENELSVQLESFDYAGKKISITFSEPLYNQNILSRVQLKSTNGGNEIPLTLVEGTSERAVYSFDAELESATEYAIIFPDQTEGVFGGILRERYKYVTSEAGTVFDRQNKWDYENYVNTKDVTVMQTQGNPNLIDNGDSYGKSLNVDLYNGNAASNKWLNWIAPVGEITSVSFDIKPLYDDLKLCVEFSSEAINTTPLYIALAQNGGIVIGNQWANAGWFTTAGMNGNWSNDGVSGSYKAGEWINFKVEFNDTTNTATVYINGEEVKSIKGVITSVANIFGGIRFRSLEDIRSSGTPVFLWDNVETGSVSMPSTVSKVRFFDATGKKYGPYDTISRSIERIDVDFSMTVIENTLDYSTVKLMYNGKTAEYTGMYDEDSQCYHIYPKVLPEKNTKIDIVIDGVMDSDELTISKYSTYVCADESEDSFSIEKQEIVTVGNNTYAKTAIVNKTDDEKKIIISLIGYDGNAMVRFSHITCVLPPYGAFYSDESRNIISVDNFVTDEIMLTIQDGITKKPYVKSIVLGEAADGTGSIEIAAKETENTDEKEISVDVLMPGKNFEDLENDPVYTQILAYKTQLKADENGNVRVAFNMPDEYAPTGIYKAYFNGENISEEKEFLYVNPTDAENAYENSLKPALTSGNKEAIAKVILENNHKLYVDVKYLDENIAEKTADLLLTYDNVEFENLKSIMNKAVAIASLSEGKIENILSESEMFDLKNSSIAEFYNKSYVNSATGKILTLRLVKENIDSIKEFDEKIDDAFILAVVENPVEPGSIKELLNAFGIYGDSDAHYKAVANNSYDSIKALSSAIDSYKPKKQSGGASGGGGSAAGGISLTVPFDGGKTEIPTENETTKTTELFADLENVLWAEEAINYLAKNDIVNGKESNKFYPLDNITREEFAKIIVSAFEVTGESDNVFYDVDDNAWYAPYINKAYFAGIINGKGDGIFGTGEKITRQDMAVMLCRGASYFGINLSTEKNGMVFADDDDISDYAVGYVYSLKNNKIVNGSGDNCFNPKAFATRAEAAKMIYEIILRKGV